MGSKRAYVEVDGFFRRVSCTDNAKRIRKLYLRFKGRCFYCKINVTLDKNRYQPHSATTDHYIPISKGGSNLLENLVLACKACNEKKGDTVPILSLHELIKEEALEKELNGKETNN